MFLRQFILNTFSLFLLASAASAGVTLKDLSRDVPFQQYIDCYDALGLTSSILDFYNINKVQFTEVPAPGTFVDKKVDLILIPERIDFDEGWVFITKDNAYHLPFAAMGDPKAFVALGKFGYDHISYPLTVNLPEAKAPLELMFQREKVCYEVRFNKDTPGLKPVGEDGWGMVDYFRYKDTPYSGFPFDPKVKGTVVPTVILPAVTKEAAYLPFFSRLYEALETVQKHFKQEAFGTLVRGSKEDAAFSYAKFLLEMELKSPNITVSRETAVKAELEQYKKPNMETLAKRYDKSLAVCTKVAYDSKIPIDVRVSFLADLILTRQILANNMVGKNKVKK